MTGPLPATILVSKNAIRDRIDNGAAIEFLLKGGKKVRCSLDPITGNAVIEESSPSGTKTTIITP